MISSRSHLCVILATITALAASCTQPDNDVAAPSGDAQHYFLALAVQERAASLTLHAPYDTLQLHVIGTLGDGSRATDSVVYSAGDSTITVTPRGLVTARFVTTSESVVRVMMTHEGRSRVDSVRIHVTDALPGLRPHDLAIVRSSDATAILPISDSLDAATRQLAVAIRAANGTALDSVLYDAQSSDTAVLTVNPSGLVRAKGTGTAYVRVSAVAYGTTMVDSLSIRVSSRSQRALSRALTIDPNGNWTIDRPTVYVAEDGIVTWGNSDTEHRVGVAFDDSTRVTAAGSGIFGMGTGDGNIAPFGSVGLTDFIDILNNLNRARRFRQLGIYHYHLFRDDAAHTPQADGMVIVCPLDDRLPCPSA